MDGTYCLGCCWLLTAILFAVGVMNLAWIGALSVFVLVEKSIPRGLWVAKAAGLFLGGWGGWMETDFSKISRLLTAEIESALKELSTYNPSDFAAENEEYLTSVDAAMPEPNGNGEELYGSVSGKRNSAR